MKRLSSFGFVPVSSLGLDAPQTKKTKTTQSCSSISLAQLDSESTDLPQSQPQETSQVSLCSASPASSASTPSHPSFDCSKSDTSESDTERVDPDPSVVRNDLGTYSLAQISSIPQEEKLWLLKNAFRPKSTKVFPQKEEYSKKRSFQHSWLKQFSWLCYSEARNGGYCVHCMLFARRTLPLGQLVTSAMTNFTRAKVTLKEHERQTTHKTATKCVVDFLNHMEKGVLSVSQQLLIQSSVTIAKNRSIIRSILKTIVFCGKQMISLRGHREHSDTNPGNFLALLDFRKDAGDMILEQHFQTAPQNARYNSPQIQNELISCAGEWIQQQILSEIKDATFFSVCADEAADCSNKEQLPLVLRFVDKVNTIREVFVEFVVCDTGTTGQAIAEKILEALKRYGLDISCLRGQCYDGAGNMAGKYKGAAKVVQDTCPKAVYVHCAAHVLNLCVVGACKVQLVKNMMGTMVEICLFFSNSPKRQSELEKQITLVDSSRAQKLVSLCKTRWVARVNALEVFFDLFPAVVETFSIISSGSSSGWNSESCRAAESLLICITRYQFIISFVVAKECLQYTKGLTVSLQKRANDICQAYSDVKTVIATLQDVRKNMVSKHRTWHETAITLGEKVNASQPQLPRRCSVQTSRSNTPGETPEVYYRRIVSIPFLDELLSHLDYRFSEIQEKALIGMKLVPTVLCDSSIPICTHDELLASYAEDLPSPSSLEAELDLWKHKWMPQSSNPNMPDLPSKTLFMARFNMWPNINTILRLICTIPVTSCECERSVSVLRRLKTYLRSTMGQERLSGLALLHTQYGMKLNLDEIVNMFARKHSRRMELMDILSEFDEADED